MMVATQKSQMEIGDSRLQIARDQLAIQFDFYRDLTREMQHKYALASAQKTQDEMNAASEAYIKSEWARNHPSQTASEAWTALGSYYANGSLSLNRVTQTKNHPPKQERILPWRLSRDDIAELHLWWDWKQLPDDVRSELLPPPPPSEMTQSFMDTNPAWRFSAAGTLVASLVDEGRKTIKDDWYDREWVENAVLFFVGAVICIVILWASS